VRSVLILRIKWVFILLCFLCFCFCGTEIAPRAKQALYYLSHMPRRFSCLFVSEIGSASFALAGFELEVLLPLSLE
jgi:hypothetical protein